MLNVSLYVRPLGRLIICAGAATLLAACAQAPTQDQTPAPLRQLVASAAADIGQPQLVSHSRDYRLQVLYSTIQRSADGTVRLQSQQYGDMADYLYPASTVKLAVAALALEYLQQLAPAGVTPDSVMHTAALLPGDALVVQDLTAASGQPSVRHYIKKILLISDNDAYNRLYELMGPDYINQRLAELGFDGARIQHRLERPLTVAQNLQTNAVTFYDAKGRLLYQQPARQAVLLPAMPATPVGRDYLLHGQLQGKPLDFSQKNRWTLAQMHRLTQMIMLPQTLPGAARLKLSPADLQFLQQQMALLPTQSTDPRYPPEQYWPAYVKFLIYGAAKDALVDPRLHIHNKVGDAYGFLLDSAYVRDEVSGAEFILSAALYVNQDGVLNDDHYDYDSIGLPFLKRLGELVLAQARAQAAAPLQAD